MSNYTKRQKEIFLIVIASIFLIVLSSYSYFIVFSPIKTVNNQQKLTADIEREILFALRKEVTTKEKSVSTSTLGAQRKVPVKPLEDAVLLQVSEAETKSGTIVRNISFTKNEFEILTPPENVENVSQVLTMVELEVNTYPELINFITEIERMERVFIIDSINFAGPEEVVEADVEKEPLILTVSFTAFYRGDLVNLMDEAPKVSAPSGSKKSDPFPYNEGKEEGEK